MTKRTTPKKTRAKKTTVKKSVAKKCFDMYNNAGIDDKSFNNVEPNTLDMITALKSRAVVDKEYGLAALLREIEKAYPVNEREQDWVKKAVNNVFHIVGMKDTWKWTKLEDYKYEYKDKAGEKKEIEASIYNVESPETLWENKPDLKETVKKVINTDRKLLAEKFAFELLKTGHFVQCRTSLIKRIKGFFGIDYKSTVFTNEEKLAEVAIKHADTLLKAIDKTKK